MGMDGAVSLLFAAGVPIQRQRWRCRAVARTEREEVVRRGRWVGGRICVVVVHRTVPRACSSRASVYMAVVLPPEPMTAVRPGWMERSSVSFIVSVVGEGEEVERMILL